MQNIRSSNWHLSTIVWGALFIWWGITALLPFLPVGTGALGIGLILLGMNAVRWRTGNPVNRFSTWLGVLALVLGLLQLARPVLGLTFELPVLEILLIVLGLMLLTNGLQQPVRTSSGTGLENLH